MKLFTKGVYRFALIVFLIGAILTVSAFSLGGKIETAAYKNITDITESYTDVKNIDIDLSISNVEIKTGDEFKIVASDVSKGEFKTYVENGNWYIKDKKRFDFFGFNFGQYNPKVTIYLPETFESEKLNIQIGAGKFEAETLSTKKADIEVGAGDFSITNLTTDDLKLEVGAGKIDIGGKVNNKGDIESGVGEVSLNLKGNKDDYNYNISLGVGDLVLNGNNVSGLGHKVIENTTGDKDFKIECGVGKVTLNIEE